MVVLASESPFMPTKWRIAKPADVLDGDAKSIGDDAVWVAKFKSFDDDITLKLR